MSPEIAAKLNNPAVQKALAYWANKAATLLMLGKSERQVKYWIQRALDGKLSHHGLEVIWRMAVVKAEEIRKQSIPIIIQSTAIQPNGHGNS